MRWWFVSQTLISSLLYNFYSVFSVILNAPKFFEAESRFNNNGTEVYNFYDDELYVSFVTMKTTSLRSNTLYLHVYSYIRSAEWHSLITIKGKFIFRLIVLSIVPLVTVSTLNVLIYTALVKSSNLNMDESRLYLIIK